MSWAIGSNFESGELGFLIVNGEHPPHLIEPGRLATEGLPATKSTTRKVYVGELRSWKSGNVSKYLDAFGLELPTLADNRHAVFSHVLEDGTVVHAPALAFLRALFRPCRFLLPFAFRPASVYSVAYLNFSTSPPEIVFDWVGKGSFDRREMKSQPEVLRWLQSSTTAIHMLQSVHLNASQGNIALELPDGRFEVQLFGLLRGRDLFVTKVRLVSVTISASDSVFEKSHRFNFLGRERYSHGASRSRDQTQFSFCSGWDPNITDSEWKQIRPMLVRSHGALSTSDRKMFEAIFRRLTAGSSWAELSHKYTCSPNSLRTTDRRWRQDGRLDAAVKAIAALRGCSDSQVCCDE